MKERRTLYLPKFTIILTNNKTRMLAGFLKFFLLGMVNRKVSFLASETTLQSLSEV